MFILTEAVFIALNVLNATYEWYEIFRTLSVLFSHNVQVNSYLTPMWTTVTQCPYKLSCHIIAICIGAALYRICVTVINCTAVNVLSKCTTVLLLNATNTNAHYRRHC